MRSRSIRSPASSVGVVERRAARASQRSTNASRARRPASVTSGQRPSRRWSPIRVAMSGWSSNSSSRKRWTRGSKPDTDTSGAGLRGPDAAAQDEPPEDSPGPRRLGRHGSRPAADGPDRPPFDPRAVTLGGRLVRLEPLAEAHRAGLHAIALDEDTWRWTRHIVTTPAEFDGLPRPGVRGRSSGIRDPVRAGRRRARARRPA